MRSGHNVLLRRNLALAIVSAAASGVVGANGEISCASIVLPLDRNIVEDAERGKEFVLSILRGGDLTKKNQYMGQPEQPLPPPPLSSSFATTVAESPGSTDKNMNIVPNEHYPAHHKASSDSDGSRQQNYSSHHHASLPREACFFPPGTWERYLCATNHDITEARRRLKSTLQWRTQNRMEDILSRPHPHFDTLKRCYPHAYHLRGRNGEPVYYECPAKINLPALRSAGLTLDHLLHHYALVTEFMWTHLSPYQEGPASKGITIIDLDGMRLRDFVGEAVTFLKRAASFTAEHYPERSGRIYVLNAPSFFQLIWRVVKPLVDPVTLAKVRVVDSNTKHDPCAICNALVESIPVENIPREYGGRSNVTLGSAPEEEWLKEVVRRR